MHKPHIHTDELYLRVIEAEVDRTAPLPIAMRDRAVRTVRDRLQAEFEEMLVVGTLKPEVITVRIREEVAKAVDGVSAA